MNGPTHEQPQIPPSRGGMYKATADDPARGILKGDYLMYTETGELSAVIRSYLKTEEGVES